MKYLVLALLPFCAAYGSASEHCVRHGSERDEAVQKLFQYLLGGNAPEELHPVVKRKLGESHDYEESIRRISESSSSTDDDPDVDLKRLVLEAVQDALQEKHLEAAEAHLQLQLKEKAVRVERYKFYAGAAGACTALLGMIGTVIAYQAAGCG